MTRLGAAVTLVGFAFVFGGRVPAVSLAVALASLALHRRLNRRGAPPPAPSRWEAADRIYLLRAEQCGLHKIGFTSRPVAARLAELQAELRLSPRPEHQGEQITLVAWGWASMQVEQALHARYQHLHEWNDLPAPTEWFRLSPVQVAEVHQFMASTHAQQAA